MNKVRLERMPFRLQRSGMSDLQDLCRPGHLIRKIKMFHYDRYSEYIKTHDNMYGLSWEDFDKLFTTDLILEDNPNSADFTKWIRELGFPYARWVELGLRIDTVYLSLSNEPVDRYNMLSQSCKDVHEYGPTIRQYDKAPFGKRK